MDDLKTKIAKLPKWVQHYINKLKMDLNQMQRDKSEMFDTPVEDAQVVLQYFYGIERDQPLPKHQRVQFFAEEHKGRWDRFIEVGIDHSKNEIVVRGADVLLIEPHASNSFAVKLKPRGRG